MKRSRLPTVVALIAAMIATVASSCGCPKQNLPDAREVGRGTVDG